MINKDRRVADVETVYDPQHGIFNNLFSTATPFVNAVDDGSAFPLLTFVAISFHALTHSFIFRVPQLLYLPARRGGPLLRK